MTPEELAVEAIMTNYNPNDGNADDIAVAIAFSPHLNAVLTKNQRLLLVRGLLDGYTVALEKRAAMKILRRASIEERLEIFSELTWDELESGLDIEQVALLRGEAADFRDFNYEDADSDTVASYIARRQNLLNRVNLIDKIKLVKALLDGWVHDDEEDDAMTILRSMTVTELRLAVARPQLGWALLQDELDKEDIVELLKRLGDFTDFDISDASADDVAIELAKDTEALSRLTSESRRLLVDALFQDYTSDEEAQAALTILLSEPSGEGLIEIICDLGDRAADEGWSILISELEADSIDRIARKISSRLDLEYAPFRVEMPWIYNRDLSIRTSPVSESVQNVVDALSTNEQAELIATVIERRKSLLFYVGTLVRREKGFPELAFWHTLQWMTEATSYRISAATQIRHEVRYLYNIATNLAEGDYPTIIDILPNLLDSTLPAEERMALFEVLRLYEPEFVAQRLAIEAMLTNTQTENLTRFTNVRQAFLQVFDPDLPAPTLLEEVIEALTELGETVAGTFTDLQMFLSNLANDIFDAATLSALLGTRDTTRAINVIGHLSSLERANDRSDIVSSLNLDGTSILARLSFRLKLDLIASCLSAFHVGDAEEQAINKIFEATDEMDRSEYFQLIDAVGFDRLDSAIHGDEWDSFLELLRCGTERYGTSKGRLNVLAESSSGANEMFRDSWTSRVYARQELADAILQGSFPGYHVRTVNGTQYPSSSPDGSEHNNLDRPVKSRLV